jgi:hypothetical protein
MHGVLHSMSMTRHIVVVAALVAIATTAFVTTSFAQNSPQASAAPSPARFQSPSLQKSASPISWNSALEAR